MFPGGKGLKIMTVSGIPIKVDWSWLIVFTLVMWTLTENYYIHTFTATPVWLNWAMGALSAILLFTSILLHEISHSLVAQTTGLPIKGITLFIFGGVAQMTEEPKSPEQEFLIAIAGPVMSFLLSVLFFTLYFFLKRSMGFTPLTAMLSYLGIINIVLIIFNMVPGMPLDGGRVLRAILWKLLGNLARATRITSMLGKGFGYLLVFFGVIQAFTGNVVGGIWLSIIGIFLTQAARMSYENIFIADILEGVTVRNAMTPDPITVPPDITLESLARNYFLRYPYGGYPVKRSREESIAQLPIHESSFSITHNASTVNMEYIEDSEAQPEINTEVQTENKIDEVKAKNTPPQGTSDLQEKPDKNMEASKPEEPTPPVENVTPDEILGYVGVNDLNTVARPHWEMTTVEELLQKRNLKCLSINPDTNLKDALGIMEQENVPCLMVMEEGKLLGTVTRQDVLELISVRSKIVQRLRK